MNAGGFRLPLVILALAATGFGSANAGTTVIRAARLLDTESGRIIRPAVVVVEGDRIRDVNPSRLPADAESIDLVNAGMTPTQALQSATIRSAELLGVDDRGRISPGLLADLIAMAGDPTKEIKAEPDIRFIMKGGKVFRRP